MCILPHLPSEAGRRGSKHGQSSSMPELHKQPWLAAGGIEAMQLLSSAARPQHRGCSVASTGLHQRRSACKLTRSALSPVFVGQADQHAEVAREALGTCHHCPRLASPCMSICHVPGCTWLTICWQPPEAQPVSQFGRALGRAELHETSAPGESCASPLHCRHADRWTAR